MPRRRRTTATVTPPVAAGERVPAVVAEAKTSVRKNVARVWQRALGNMGVGHKATGSVMHERSARAQTNEVGRDDESSREAWTLDASVVEVESLDVSAAALVADSDADAEHSESGVYAFGPLGRRASGARAVGTLDREDGPGLLDAAALRDLPSDAMRAATAVTLIVYGWSNVEPGTLSWVFPTLRAALSAARTMKNAARWAILAGPHDPEAETPFDVTAARATGHVLVEDSG